MKHCLSCLLLSLNCAVSLAQPLRVVAVVSGLQDPWALAFLPDGRMLITEKGGALRIAGTDGRLSQPLAGMPEIAGAHADAPKSCLADGLSQRLLHR